MGMKFQYWKFPDRQKAVVSLPIIEVNLFAKDGGGRFNYPCLVDSGADYCFFHAREIGRGLLGLDIEKGEKLERIKGITGAELEAYLHVITYQIGGWDFKTKIAFSYNLGSPFGVLGREGFFEFFKVCIEHRKEVIELKQYPK